METLGVNVNTIIANARTDALLEESQRLTSELQARSEELQDQQVELQRSNAELEEKAALLAAQNRDIETKNPEIEQARQEMEERAQQLALASKYKSQFLANMSHELRTPLNSLLILARLLAQNPGRNLTAKQVEYANVIHSAGSDLLQLINDILDLSKVEAGRMDIHAEQFPLSALLEDVQATFQPLTAEKGLDFAVEAGPRRRSSCSPTGSGSGRCSATCCRTRSSSPSAGTCGCAWPGRAAHPGRRRHAGVLGGRHRHRHRAGEPHHHLRRVPAGRRHAQPQVRRDRPRPVDRPRDRRPARRRDHRGERARPGQHLHLVPAVRAARGRARRDGCGEQRRRRRAQRRGQGAGQLGTVRGQLGGRLGEQRRGPGRDFRPGAGLVPGWFAGTAPLTGSASTAAAISASGIAVAADSSASCAAASADDKPSRSISAPLAIATTDSWATEARIRSSSRRWWSITVIRRSMSSSLPATITRLP